MRNRSLTAECNKIFNFWKLEEYFTPSDYPELTLTIKEGREWVKKTFNKKNTIRKAVSSDLKENNKKEKMSCRKSTKLIE